MIKKLFITMLVLCTVLVQSSEARAPKVKKITVCKPVYTVKSELNQGAQIVKCDKLYGIKNSFSYPVVAPRYAKMINIDDNYVKVSIGKNQWGILTYLGRPVVKPIYKDVAITRIQLGSEDADYLFFGKKDKTWYFLNEGKEIPVAKLKRGEKFEPIFATTLHKIPHKVIIDGNKYRLLMGKVDMTDLLVGTPIKVHVSEKLPKWADLKIADLALVSIVQKK